MLNPTYQTYTLNRQNFRAFLQPVNRYDTARFMASNTDYSLFLKAILMGELTTLREILLMQQQYQIKKLPNALLVIEGFYWENDLSHENVQQLIMNTLNDVFSKRSHLYFVHNGDHLVVLFHIPENYVSVKNFFTYENSLQNVVLKLLEQHIHLQIGASKFFYNLLNCNDFYRDILHYKQYIFTDILFLEDATTHPMILKSFDYIHEFAKQGISIHNVAKHLNFSTSHFSKLFKFYTGYGFLEYYRLHRATILLRSLRNVNDSIESIALSHGYSTPSYFYASFKKKFRFTPGQFRKSTVLHFH